jgi:hypothetical protein
LTDQRLTSHRKHNIALPGDAYWQTATGCILNFRGLAIWAAAIIMARDIIMDGLL